MAERYQSLVEGSAGFGDRFMRLREGFAIMLVQLQRDQILSPLQTPSRKV